MSMEDADEEGLEEEESRINNDKHVEVGLFMRTIVFLETMDFWQGINFPIFSGWEMVGQKRDHLDSLEPLDHPWWTDPKHSQASSAQERDHFPDEWDELEAEAAAWQVRHGEFTMKPPCGHKNGPIEIL
jgi:hypothetical protein